MSSISSKLKPTLRLADEGEQIQRIRPVDSVARGRASGRDENAGRLIQSERLPGRPRPLRHLTDQECVPAHGHTLNPALRGKVKGLPRPDVRQPLLPDALVTGHTERS
jgi:hypothetical protein